MRRLAPALLVLLVLAPAGGAATLRPAKVPLGRSERGRPIVAFHTANPRGTTADTYYPRPRPFSERETRIARNLILRIRPRVTIWYHQHMDLVWAWRQSSRAGRIYARAAGMRVYHHHWLLGTAPTGRTITSPARRPSPSSSRPDVSRRARCAVTSTQCSRSAPRSPRRRFRSSPGCGCTTVRRPSQHGVRKA